MNRRTLLVVAGWVGAAALAVLAGLAGISILGSGLTSAGTSPRSEAQVARELAAAPEMSVQAGPSSASAAAPSAQPSSSARNSPVSRTLKTTGGTVVARCVAGAAEIVAMSPAQGYALHERAGAEGEFRAISDNHDRVRFIVGCTSGRPALTSRDDD
ncbi:hypothetical protein [Actinoplanes sp. NPDC051859]|uniref:hypothetical protein n=1 Tax=Actinoplanes sp. NPDC051859 TaxID=3363909 RepID=UPI0037882C23